MRVLVVEDERILADAIAEWLRDEAHAVDTAGDGESALERIAVNDYDVVILDRDLPLVHGDDVCRELVESESTARVLMLPAAGEIGDRVTGLSLGADDYLPKPFAVAELSARVQALGRRARPALPPALRGAGRTPAPAPREVYRTGPYGPLSARRRAVGAVVSCERLLEKARDENADPFTGVVRLTVLKLRRKLGDPPVVLTVPGAGYRIP